MTDSSEEISIPTDILIRRFIRRTIRELDGANLRHTTGDENNLPIDHGAIRRFIEDAASISIQETQLPSTPPDNSVRLLVPNEDGTHDVLDAQRSDILQLMYDELRAIQLDPDRRNDNFQIIQDEARALWSELHQNIADWYFESGQAWMTGIYLYQLKQDGIRSTEMVPDWLLECFPVFSRAMQNTLVMQDDETMDCTMVRNWGVEL